MMAWVKVGEVPSKQRFSIIVDRATHPDLAAYLFRLEYRQGNRALINMLEAGRLALAGRPPDGDAHGEVNASAIVAGLMGDQQGAGTS